MSGSVADISERIQGIINSPSVNIVPVGDAQAVDRGILQVGNSFGRLQAAVKAVFSSVVIAAALAAAPAVQAQGVGYDANVYGQAQGQVMQQGSAQRMTVVDVRAVKIEVAARGQTAGSQMTGYAVTGAGAAIGAIAGQRMGHNPSSSQIYQILGGLGGGVAANMINNSLNSAPETRQVDGVALTMVNPATNQLTTITQAGTQMFSPGDKVLVLTNGGSSRVVPDRSQEQERYQSPRDNPQGYGDRGVGPQGAYGGQASPQETAAADRLLFSVMKAATTMGIQLDVAKVADLLEKGVGERSGMHVGKVVGVDRELGLVYQDAGRGKGVVYAANSLTRVPAVGETVSVNLRNGMGYVNSSREQAMGRGRS